MCGLTGLFSSQLIRSAVSVFVLERSAESITHRGPNSSGFYHSPSGTYHVVHRRLAILDLSPAGHQPMVSECGSWVLAFNGEIYNHLDLRAELEATRVISWRGHSDTETLLHALQAWGLENTLKKCVGMFAIALWNTQTRTLQLARDRFGEKPLYFGFLKSRTPELNGALVFASELKAIAALPGFANPVNLQALGEYFRLLYVPGELSIYEGIGKLTPGAVLTVNANNVEQGYLPAAKPYWQYLECVQQGQANHFESEAEALAAVEHTLNQAVQGQCLADVPLGAFLSGGVDSSLITALMQSQSSRAVDTFTVGFDAPGYDESAHAQAVANHLGTNHHELRVSGQDALDVIPSLPSMYCEPFSDSSQIPTFLVCKSARPHATVALSGDAGDELFGGYNRYLWANRVWGKLGPMGKPGRNAVAGGIQLLSPAAWDQLGGFSGKVVRVGEKLHKLADRISNTTSLDDFYQSLISEWRDPQQLLPGYRALPTDNPASSISDPIARMMVNDALGYLPGDILVKVDRAAMAISLETRAPFLDHRVAELAWRLPPHMKIRDGVGKWALRQILYRHVPRELIERPKAGFAIPLAIWLRGPLREWAEHLISPQVLNSHGLLNNQTIAKTWREHQSGRFDHSAKLWAVLMFQAWYLNQNN